VHHADGLFPIILYYTAAEIHNAKAIIRRFADDAQNTRNCKVIKVFWLPHFIWRAYRWIPG